MSLSAVTGAMLLVAAPVQVHAVVAPAAPVAHVAPLPVEAVPAAATDPAPPAQPPVLPAPVAPLPVAPLPVDQAPAAVPPAVADPSDIIVTAQPRTPGDPLQALNRQSFAITQAVDDAVVGPAARAYDRVVPTPVRNGLRNFLNNLHEPIIALNFLLQGKPGKAAETLGRFAINSTLGVAGVFDFARRRTFKLPRRRNGFANTLAIWGVGPGPFLFLPFVGATTVRDLLGGVADGAIPPLAGKPFNQLSYTIPTGINRGLDRRASIEEQVKQQQAAPNPYATARETYLLRRQAEIDEVRGRPAAPAANQGTPAAPPASAPPSPN